MNPRINQPSAAEVARIEEDIALKFQLLNSFYSGLERVLRRSFADVARENYVQHFLEMTAREILQHPAEVMGPIDSLNSPALLRYAQETIRRNALSPEEGPSESVSVMETMISILHRRIKESALINTTLTENFEQKRPEERVVLSEEIRRRALDISVCAAAMEKIRAAVEFRLDQGDQIDTSILLERLEEQAHLITNTTNEITIANQSTEEINNAAGEMDRAQRRRYRGEARAIARELFQHSIPPQTWSTGFENANGMPSAAAQEAANAHERGERERLLNRSQGARRRAGTEPVSDPREAQRPINTLHNSRIIALEALQQRGEGRAAGGNEGLLPEVNRAQINTFQQNIHPRDAGRGARRNTPSRVQYSRRIGSNQRSQAESRRSSQHRREDHGQNR